MMSGFLMVLLLITMLAVLGVVRVGSPARSNQLMRWRVILQGVALALFTLLMLSKK